MVLDASIDVDVVGAAVEPGTGTPVVGGPDLRQASDLLHLLALARRTD